jgi:RNA polymerase sigma-70 factor (ECF subfamily)
MAIVHFLYRMVQDRLVAEELAMEVFERACRPGPDNAPEVTTRLFRLAADLALQEQPDRKARPTAGCAGDVCEEARRVVAGMPGKQRAAVLLHKYHQMDCGQIARILDCSEAAARLLLLAAYDLLRGRLALYETARDLDYIAQ